MSAIRLILIIILTAASLGLIWFMAAPDTPVSSTNNLTEEQISYSNLSSRIEFLENKVDNQQNRLAEYESKLDGLEQQLIESQLNQIDQANHEKQSQQQKITENKTLKPPTLQEKLLATNMPLDTVQSIQQLIGDNRMARLQLRNQAIREDWFDSPEYFEKAQLLPGALDGIREQFGDQVFDQYLYASGRPNRVVVVDVFSDSAAKVAGIQSGDIILSYASKAIFSMSELQQATTEGIAGENVLIEFMRDDSFLTTSVPRGPMGISMSMLRKKPE